MSPETPSNTADSFSSGTLPGATAAESLAEASARLVRHERPGPALFRVVEVTRDAQGRLCRHGRIWHPDLTLVRRFGRALAANSDAHKVEVFDARGQVLETIAPLSPDSSPAGWDGWRSLPLPPAPPAPAPVRRRDPRADLPVLSSPLEPETEAEMTRTL